MYKIYKLVYEGEVVYIGKTKTSLSVRKSKKNYNEDVMAILDSCEIILIEETDNVSRERYWINFYGIDNLLNIRKGDGRTDEERKETRRLINKKWNDANKEYKSKKFKEYYKQVIQKKK